MELILTRRGESGADMVSRFAGHDVSALGRVRVLQINHISEAR